MTGFWKLWIGALVLVGFLVLIFTKSSSPKINLSTSRVDRGVNNVKEIPSGIVLKEKSKLSSSQDDNFDTVNKSNQIFQKETIKNIPILNKLTTLIQKPYFSPSAPSSFLTLPVVSKEGLRIDLAGVETVESFAAYLVRHERDIDFSFGKFVLRASSTAPLFPDELVGILLKEGNSTSIHDSMVVMREFFNKKIDFLKSIPVSDKGISISQIIIGLDLLTIDLIDQFFAFENKKISREDLEDFYDKYSKTILYYNQNFQKQYAKSSSWSFFKKAHAQIIPVGGPVGIIQGVLSIIKNIPGLSSEAKAALNFIEGQINIVGQLQDVIIRQFGPSLLQMGIESALDGGVSLDKPFGGLITVIFPCVCEAGLQLHYVPVRGGMVTPLYLSYVLMATPAFYLYRAPVNGAWILGKYTNGGPNCSIPTLLGCTQYAPKNQGTIIMAGTSLPG